MTKILTFFPDLKTACFEDNILELWARNGKYDRNTDRDIQNLNTSQILDAVNHQNYRYRKSDLIITRVFLCLIKEYEITCTVPAVFISIDLVFL